MDAIVAPGAAVRLRRPVLAWYRRHLRLLPWRGTRDPYRIWVSEVMLQQTQVATAIPFYQSFLERFPTLRALARGREAQVLAAWSGLGYYRRARNLLAAARQLARDHAGRVPDDPVTFGSLPGVGRYTSGAVLSIAFDRSLPVLDGNVARVLSRWFAVRAAYRDPRGARTLWALAESLVPMRGAGDWNQALIELGAVVCTPRRPSCGVCPARRTCRARLTGAVADYPPVAPRPEVRRTRRALAIVTRRSRLLVVRREGALLGGLWEPPGVEDVPPARTRAALAGELRRLGVATDLRPTGVRIAHRITRHAIDVELWQGAAHAAGGAGNARWIDPARPSVPLTGLARKSVRALRG